MVDIYLKKLFKTTEQKILIPGPNWTVMSFHAADGKLVTGSTTNADPQVLFSVGDITDNWGEDRRREQGIHFVKIKARVDLTSVTEKDTSIVFLETFIQLRQGARVIKNGAGQEITVRTFLGHAEICTMTKDRF